MASEDNPGIKLWSPHTCMYMYSQIPDTHPHIAIQTHNTHAHTHTAF